MAQKMIATQCLISVWPNFQSNTTPSCSIVKQKIPEFKECSRNDSSSRKRKRKIVKNREYVNNSRAPSFFEMSSKTFARRLLESKFKVTQLFQGYSHIHMRSSTMDLFAYIHGLVK